LSRWSRRKSAHRAGRESADAEKPKSAAEQAPAPAKNAQVPDDAPPPKDLPPLESLTLESDYARFLKPDVPGPLRKEALRKLWVSDPALARMDPLDLHNLDYTFPKVSEVVTSLFQVGRGMVLPEDETPKDKAKRIEGTPETEAPVAPATPPEAPRNIEIADAKKDKEHG
jgi:hypothetical protein